MLTSESIGFAVARGQRDRHLHALPGVDEVGALADRDVRLGRALHGEVVELQVAGGVACQVDREAPHRGQVQHTVRRCTAGLVVRAADEVAERRGDLRPAGAAVGEEGLPQLGVLGVGAAVLDLVLDLLPGAGLLDPEAEGRVVAPVLRRGEIVAEAAVAGDRVRDVEGLIARGRARQVRSRNERECGRVRGVAPEREHPGVRRRDDAAALEVLDDRQRALLAARLRCGHRGGDAEGEDQRGETGGEGAGTGAGAGADTEHEEPLR